jgi:RNA polymerase sigma-70 factor
VHEALPYPADFEFAQKCLEGDTAAIVELQGTFGPVISSYLVHRGASAKQANDLTDGLWADCLVARSGRRPRLATYNGQAPLQVWLKTVALNELIRLHALEKRRLEISIDEQIAPTQMAGGAAMAGEVATEAPLLVLMRTSLEAAFQQCSAEDFVLLQLAHSDGLLLDELARMFCCASSTISRRLDVAQKKIAEETLRHIRVTDPLIDLKWEDFVELCRVASPACFGID